MRLKLGLLACLALAVPKPDQPAPAFGHGRVRFADGSAISVELARTQEQREYGLMFRKSLPKDYGMLFVFPKESGLWFWMKNTYVSLDIVFIGKDKRITAVHERVRASMEKTPDESTARAGGMAQYVLELPAGRARTHHLRPGQRLFFKVVIPKN